MTFFFLFSIVPFVSFVNLSFFFYLTDFFFFFKFFLICYLFFFLFFVFVVDARQYFFSKKDELNQLYIKYIYFYYTALTTGYAFLGVLYTKVMFFLKITVKAAFLNIFFLFFYFLQGMLSYFIFWKPITKRTSYFGLFRVSRAKWVYNSAEELNRFKY